MTTTNRLAQETSPYLQQHAHNPVDWYPWNEEALNKAKQENKPLLVSIGYAACHWCHVMAHESFEDESTAKLMNELFVNIKVDREERPDLDKVFQTAHYILTHQSGGWPLTIFLTPDDLTPFFCGTYFPSEGRYQLPAFRDVLKTLADIYKNRPQDIKQQNQQLINIIQYQHTTDKNVKLSDEPVKLANQVLREKFDKQYGGFSGAPKFPHPTIIEYLLHEKSAMARETLLHMAQGGIYDQLQGGFFRYTIDEKWLIPHFEKMLYDNGQLLALYASASQIFNEPYFAEIARETADWVITKMQSPEGGYYSSLDADSEGHEGKFYVWDKSEVEKLLTEKEAQVGEIYFGLSEQPNFEKHWHLHVAKSLEKVAEQLKISSEEAKQLLASAKQKLLAARKQRVEPFQDKKILTAWNALMIKGMLIAGDILQEPRYVDSAHKALQFIQEKLWVNNRLLASYKDGKANIPAFLDDYAYLLDAVITSLQLSWHTKNLEFAIKLADNLLTHFTDKENGGFFFTADDHEKILYRPKTMMDEAIPAGNGLTALALLTLGHLMGDTRYIDAVEKTLKGAWPALKKFPAEHCSLLLALRNFLKPLNLIIIRGEESEINKWHNFAKKKNRLNNEIFAIPIEDTNLPGLLGSRKPEGNVCAYVCQGTKCLPVITEFHEFKKQLI